jgi:competence protein ComEC
MDEITSLNYAFNSAKRTAQGAYWRKQLALAELWLEAERDQIGLWLPVALGAGIVAWMLIPNAYGWVGFILLALAVAGFGRTFASSKRIGQMCLWGGAAAALGCALIWWKADVVSAPILSRPVITIVEGNIEQVETMAARSQIRIIITQNANAGLPKRIRITVRDTLLKIPNIAGLALAQPDLNMVAGQKIRVRARLMPPPQASLPGGYNFAQRAWFDRISAVGSALSQPEILKSTQQEQKLRDRLAAHIQTRLGAQQAGIAIALAAGDQGAIADADADAMRQSGLAHLLSISGLHVTAIVGAAMFLCLRLFSLSPVLATRLPLVLVAAGAGAIAGIGYTWISGAQVPTVRSCVAAVLVLIALGIGRDALTMRLLAVGAIIILLLKPDALFGPSFQLSFAAIAAIMAIHSHSPVKRFLQRRDEGMLHRSTRALAGLLITGLAVEIALMPIALFHFHKTGIYGAAANLVAIPLTTFVIMPLEGAALVLDGMWPAAHLGTPFWWLCDHAISLLLGMAHKVADTPGSVAMVPYMGVWSYGLMICGGLWLLLWQSRARIWGAVPIIIGVILIGFAPKYDLFITADGRHVATHLPSGEYAMLRERSGEFVRDMMGEASGTDAEMQAIGRHKGAKCSPDFCVWSIRSSTGRTISVMASRSNEKPVWSDIVAACAKTDIVISDRWLPRACKPRWLRADTKFLAQSGGLAIDVDGGAIWASRAAYSGKPWENPPKIAPPRYVTPNKVKSLYSTYPTTTESRKVSPQK